MSVIKNNLSSAMTEEQKQQMVNIEHELQKTYEQSRTDLIFTKNSTFISTILFNIKTFFTFEVPTAGTDGIALYINPEFFMKLTKGQRVFLLAHETWHIVFMHMNRAEKPEIDKELYNQAADYVINLMLVKENLEFIEGGLLDTKYEGMSTEEVYELLKQKGDSQLSSNILQGDIQKPGSGKDSKTDNKSQKEIEQNIQNQTNELINRAAVQSEISGDSMSNLPSDIVRHLDELRNPRLDWRTILRNFMSSLNKDDYSYRRPNKRFMPEYYMPSMYSEALGEIAFAVDASGSVSQEEFTAYINEIKYIKDSLQPELTTVIDFDTEIHNVYEMHRGQPWDESISFNGGGGTSLFPVFEKYEEKAPTVLIVFSDLQCTPIKKDPGYPVIWICVNNSRAEVNFGELIHIKI